MLPILAWRNIWRNPTRSFVVIMAIALGIWAGLTLTGFATGMVQDYIKNNISNVVAHIQIHDPDYARERDVRKYLKNYEELAKWLKSNPEVNRYSPRTLATGMASSANGSRGVTIKGVWPKLEAAISDLEDNVREGTYFEAERKNQVLIGQKLADKLKVKLLSKLVLTFQDLDGTITSGAFRVVGIYYSGNTPFDEANVFVPAIDLQNLLRAPGQNGSEPLIHEVALLCSSVDAIPQVEQQLRRAFPQALAENYRKLAPELQVYESQMKSVAFIYLGIIMLALIFGIVNTMLMAVLERFRELGMLMAIGMNKGRVFGMIILETLLLSLVGAPLGMALGMLTVEYFRAKGLDLSAFSSSLNKYGLSNVVHFYLAPEVYWQAAVMLAITALLAALYPAFKAIRLNPAEAIRKI